MLRPDLYFSAFVVMAVFAGVIAISDRQWVRTYLRMLPFAVLFSAVPEQYAVTVFVLYLYVEVLLSAFMFLPDVFNEMVKV